MNKKLKYYLIYLMIFLIGASVSGGISFAYDFSVVSDISAFAGGKISFISFVRFSYEFLLPIVLTFLSSFTIYACAVSGFFSLICGARLGIMAIQYGKSGLNVFSHALALIFLIIFAFLHTYLSTESALYRTSLRYAAPDPKELIRQRGTKAIFKTFIYMALSTIALSLALYFFVIFFPLS